MEKLVDSSEKVRKCGNCAYSMPSVNTSSGLRCGQPYYMKHPITRKMDYMNSYKEIGMSHVCNLWSDEIRDSWREEK